jgi:N-acetylmuramoyl-L-alanine amidase
MVHRSPAQLSRGILIALTLICAPFAAHAQTLGVAPAIEDGINALLGRPSKPVALTAPAVEPKAPHPRRTRFLIGLPKPAKFEVFSLSHPNRVIIEVAETKLRLPAEPKASPMGLVKSFRAGQSSSKDSRIILYVTEPVIVSSARMMKARDGGAQTLVVEIEPFGSVTATASINRASSGVVPVSTGSNDKPLPPPPFALGAAGLQPPMPRPAVSPEVLGEKSYKPVIVIDPGHGGHDSGATKNGAVEKDIVLAFGKILAEKLKASGRYKVLMTRDKDVFVPLGERVEFGEQHGANLFIAIHCDYADSGGRANGATIYSLRDSLADRLRRSAKGDIGEGLLSKDDAKAIKEASGDVDAVRSILADLADREVDVTRDRTTIFARSVIEGMGASTTMREDPDKQAGFRVLKTAQFPSILIELAYVTNKRDAANLKSDAWRDKVSDSIMTAIDSYFSNKLAQLPM